MTGMAGGFRREFYMRRMTMMGLAAGMVLGLLAPAGAAPARGPEWPGWQGAARDNKSPDKGLLKQWPEGGPKLLWQKSGIGVGFSSVAVSGGRIFISGVKDGQLSLEAFDMNGQPLWSVVHGPERGGPDGSRGTPTVDGGLVYLESGNGLITCYDVKDGRKVWSRDFKEFGGGIPGWGYSEAPLIYKEMLIVTPGGKSCMVALNKKTGETVWTSTGFDAPAHYCSPIAVTFQGVPMIINGTGGGIFAVDPKDGSTLWSDRVMAGNTANCCTPAYSDGYVFWSNGYGRGAVCFKLSLEDGKVKAEKAWENHNMDCHHGGYFILDGCIYGNNGGGWACLDLKSGEKKWNVNGVGKGSLTYADGMMYLFGESGGRAGLATCSPEGTEMKGTFNVAGKGPSWAHPVVIGGRLYLRYDDNLYCFDVKAP